MLVKQHFMPTGVGGATQLRRALGTLSFTHGGSLDIACAANTRTTALTHTEDSGVAIDAARILTCIDSKIVLAADEPLALLTPPGVATSWASGPPLDDVHDLLDELTVLGIAQLRQKSDRNQAIAAASSFNNQAQQSPPGGREGAQVYAVSGDWSPPTPPASA